MNTTLVLATLSREALNQMVVGSIATMVAGALFFFIGAILGWMLWKNAPAKTAHYTSENKDLLKGREKKKQRFLQLRERLEGLVPQTDQQ